MCGFAVLPFITRPKDPGSYCLARIGVCAGSPPPALPLGRRWLAANCGSADRQFRGLPDHLAHRRVRHRASGSLHGRGIRILRVLGFICTGWRILVRTATLGEGCLCDRRSWYCSGWADGRASACSREGYGFTRYCSRWAGNIHGAMADRSWRFAGSRSAGRVTTPPETARKPPVVV